MTSTTVTVAFVSLAAVAVACIANERIPEGMLIALVLMLLLHGMIHKVDEAQKRLEQAAKEERDQGDGK